MEQHLPLLPILSDASRLRDAIAVDCEMVRVGRGRKALARVCLVDWDERVLLHSFVAPPAPVVDYETQHSGVTAACLEGAPSFEAVREAVGALVCGRALVGHALANDLKALALRHPAELLVDTQALLWGAGRRTGLKALANELLGWAIQGGTHHPAEDALASLRLLKWYLALGTPPPRREECALHAAAPRAPPTDAPGCTLREAGDAPRAEWALTLAWSTVGVKDLLEWFDAEARCGAAVELRFGRTLAKEERQLIHKTAQALSLSTVSEGIGEERAIRVLSADAPKSAPRPWQVHHLARLITLRAREHPSSTLTSTACSLRMPTFDELQELLLQQEEPLPAQYEHLQSLREYAQKTFRRAYTSPQTVPQLLPSVEQDVARLQSACQRRGMIMYGLPS
ncbi:hypothetical protein AB1Y20_018696 [Prymnesium parvum]|uniref:R3H domain-containing protein n=1 Tax=Prymnesium parvum TaxID=97485 RepID=A0AB34JT30_PRYPA